MQKSLSVQCLHPKRIVNPYTHEKLVVPCGHCRACALKRNQHLAFLCDLEAQSHKYCVFITLTYANRYIPRAQLVDSLTTPFSYDLVSEDGEIFGDSNMNSEQVEKLLQKMHLFGAVPYLRKSDLQKFLKRFRYYAKKITKERVRYFGCGEYGPTTFRPHYHLLLYFSSEELLQACYEIVSTCWPFGRIDCQLSRGSVSSYVAGYVNSTCLVPEVLKIHPVRPFVVHSTQLGQGFLDSQSEEIYSLTPDEFIKRGMQINGKYREFFVWRSYYSYWYPRCKGYSRKSSRERLDAYRIYDKVRQAFPYAENPKTLAVLIAERAYYFGNDFICNREENGERYTVEYQALGLPFDQPIADISVDTLWNDILGYFVDFIVMPTIGTLQFDRWVNRIYLELLISRKFLYKICKNRTYVECQSKLKMIENFYSRLDYLHLLDFYESQSCFFDSDLLGCDDLMSDGDNVFVPYFYNNVDYDHSIYEQSLVYKTFSCDVQQLFQDRIKHKELNDKNKIFLNEDE